jgi:alpha-N-arabinofuranosidase
VNLIPKSTLFLLCPLSLSPVASTAQNTTSTIEVKLEDHGKPISPNLFGIFFADLSYAADGGLYAELVQNRSFLEYTSADTKGWNSLTGWLMILGNGAEGTLNVEHTEPLNARDPDYGVLSVQMPGAGVALCNNGFDGMVGKAGETYNLSLFARQLSGPATPMPVRKESKSGEVLSKATLSKPTKEWARYSATLRATKSDDGARLVLMKRQAGRIALDVVSLP